MNNFNNKKALVLGIDDRAALAVIRSLGRKGVHVDFAADFPGSVCAFSKYTKKVFPMPNAGKQTTAWVESLGNILTENRYDLVIPTADNYLVPCVKNRKILEKLALFAIPDDYGFEYTYDKNKTLKLAEKLGVPCPHSYTIQTPEDIELVLNELRFPVIVKPVSSKVWTSESRHALKVQLVKNEDDLRKLLEKYLKITPVLVQSYHTGIGLGQEFLCHKGRIVARFQHQRVHEPLGGGGSSYRKSVQMHPALLEHSGKLLSELNWTGVAMVEYKFDPASADAVLMEINGRFWGSLPLAIHAGVDFPALLFDMMVNGNIPSPSPYRINIYCRNIVRDLEWFRRNWSADKRDPFNLAVPVYKLFPEIFNLLLLRERYDTLVSDDLKPGILHLKRYFREKWQGLAAKIRKTTGPLKYRVVPIIKKHEISKIAERLNSDSTILFVCKGNICRSPFAEYYLKSKLASGTPGGFRVLSTGFIEKINRTSPDTAISVAREFGIDLSTHRSSKIDEKMVVQSDLIFVMDFELMQMMKVLFPNHATRVHFLSIFNPNGSDLEISDPYGGQARHFKKVYQQIADSLDGFAAELKQQN